VELGIEVGKQVIAEVYRSCHQLLDSRGLLVRLSVGRIKVSVSSHKWKKRAQLIEKNIELIIWCPRKTWDIGSYERDSTY
jgi:hypothetical protein